jgi:hypothetical protein
MTASNKWYCLRHEGAGLQYSSHVDEARMIQHRAWCSVCFGEIDKMREELKMYHELDEKIRALQAACHTVLSP